MKTQDIFGLITPAGVPLIGASVAISALKVALHLRAAQLTSVVTLSLFSGKFGKFKRLLVQYLATLVSESVLKRASHWVLAQLQLCWRKRLTELLSARYFERDNYYQLLQDEGLPDADVRIVDDVRTFAESAASALDSIVHHSLTGLVFTGLIAKQSGVAYALTPWLYLVASSKAISWIAKVSWSKVTASVKKHYSKYYRALQRVQVHAESIAALEGSEAEQSATRALFATFMRAQYGMLNDLLKHGLATNFFFYQLSGAFAYGVSFSSAFKEADAAGRIAKTQLDTFLYWTALSSAGGIASAISDFEKAGGAASRIGQMFDALDRVAAEGSTERAVFVEDADKIEFDSVDVVTPTGIILVRNLSFKLEAASGSIMVTGHNGAGKSSIFRCLAGLWTAKAGKIHRPGATADGIQNVVYLPQKPYCAQGLLIEQLCYPSLPVADVKQEDMDEVLAFVELSHLSQGTEQNWEETLSLGEKQRLGMARLLLHRKFALAGACFAVLDECTSAVTSSIESKFYMRLQCDSIAYITISHRPTLEAYHSQLLRLEGNELFTLQQMPPVGQFDESASGSVCAAQGKSSNKSSDAQQGSRPSPVIADVASTSLSKLDISSFWSLIRLGLTRTTPLEEYCGDGVSNSAMINNTVHRLSIGGKLATLFCAVTVRGKHTCL
jgi:ABC-type uncharacterized transport system fused permease/ATPase subunit